MTSPLASIENTTARDARSFFREVASIDRSTSQENVVYVLECIQPFEDDEKVRELLKRRYSPNREDMAVNFEYFPNSGYEYPTQLDMAIFADEVYYVGQTESLARRIREHLMRGGATLTKNFPPISLCRVEWMDSRREALSRESELLNTIGNMDEFPEYFDMPNHWESDIDKEYGLIQVYRKNARNLFPSANLSDREAARIGKAIKYAENQNGVELSEKR